MASAHKRVGSSADPQTRKARVIAFYLPQYHPIPENDEWWGKGFTEWTNVAKARPLFRGHYQPHVPADLGFYDLRVPETRWAQAEMARAHGIEAFCYWHYWFAGRRMLERPFNEVLASKKPDYPFCLAWANQTWSGIWHGNPKRILVEQTYPGESDHIAHFYTLLGAFVDDRYVKVDGKPLLYLFQPYQIPDLVRVTDLWRDLAHRAGLRGLYIVGESTASWVPREHGCDASVVVGVSRFLTKWAPWSQPGARLKWEKRRLLGVPTVCDYARFQERFAQASRPGPWNHPCLVPNWDNTPRSGTDGLVLHGSTPELFRRQVRRALSQVQFDPSDSRLVFVKSWNEWAEGNHLEPDLRFGTGYLQVIREELENATVGASNDLDRSPRPDEVASS